MVSTSVHKRPFMNLHAGNYIFYFAVDGNMDGEVDATWLDYVEVLVE